MDPESTAFDESSRPVQWEGFDYDSVDAALNPQANEDGDSVDRSKNLFVAREVVCRVLEMLTEGNASPKSIGMRALALQHALNAGPHQSQRELAERMRVTPGRASQILNALESEAARFLREN